MPSITTLHIGHIAAEEARIRTGYAQAAEQKRTTPERIAEALARDLKPFALVGDVRSRCPDLNEVRALTVARAICAYGSAEKAADFANHDGLFQHLEDLQAYMRACAAPDAGALTLANGWRQNARTARLNAEVSQATARAQLIAGRSLDAARHQAAAEAALERAADYDRRAALALQRAA